MIQSTKQKSSFRTGVFFTLILMTTAACAQKDKGSMSSNSGSAQLNSQIDSVSYVMGVTIAHNIEQGGMKNLNFNAYMAGMHDAMDKDTSMIDDKEGQMMVNNYFQGLHKKLAEDNKKAAEDFLAKNKTADGVKTTDSGLEYKVLKEGNGPKPTASDKVVVNYTGSLLNGHVFDSSKDRGSFHTEVNRVIPGWTEALQLMPVGSKFRIWVSPELGYGARGAGRDIGPNELLVFDIELLSIDSAQTSKPNMPKMPAPGK